MPDLQLALAFDTDSAEFARGVEIGRLWEQVRAAADDELVEQEVHVANAEMCMRIGEATGRSFEADVHDDTWMTVRYGVVD